MLSLYQAVKAHTAVGRRGSHIFLHNQLTDGGEAVSLTCRPPFTPRRLRGTLKHRAAGRVRPSDVYNEFNVNGACNLWPSESTSDWRQGSTVPDLGTNCGHIRLHDCCLIIHSVVSSGAMAQEEGRITSEGLLADGVPEGARFSLRRTTLRGGSRHRGLARHLKEQLAQSRRGSGFDSRRYQIFRIAVLLERGPLSPCEVK
jgi:hypothetical protein